MSWMLVLQRVVRSDIASVARWYQRQRPGLEHEFRMDLEATFDRLRRGPPFVAPIHDDVRFEKLSRFPYVVYFRQFANRIEVIAILHEKRNPRIWQRRANRKSELDPLDEPEQ